MTPRAVRVLVVDDDPDSVTGLLHLLRDEGFEALGTNAGKEALSMLRSFDPDVVLLDIAMPDLNGWDVARRIRGLKGFRRPVLIGMTGVYTDDPDVVLGKMSGLDHYLAKPYDLSNLLALLAPLRE